MDKTTNDTAANIMTEYLLAHQKQKILTTELEFLYNLQNNSYIKDITDGDLKEVVRIYKKYKSKGCKKTKLLLQSFFENYVTLRKEYTYQKDKDNRVYLEFVYDMALILKVKETADRQWHPDLKMWSVPIIRVEALKRKIGKKVFRDKIVMRVKTATGSFVEVENTIEAVNRTKPTQHKQNEEDRYELSDSVDGETKDFFKDI